MIFNGNSLKMNNWPHIVVEVYIQGTQVRWCKCFSLSAHLSLKISI